MTEFHNQHIVVTGATSGIGRVTPLSALRVKAPR